MSIETESRQTVNNKRYASVYPFCAEILTRLFRQTSLQNVLVTACLITSPPFIQAARAETSPDPVKMEHFAQGSELSSADSEFRRIELQPVVITGIQRRDLRDIRVYDANNEPMPSLLLKKDGTIKTSHKALSTAPQYNKGEISAYVLDRGSNTASAIESLHLTWRGSKSPKFLAFSIEHSNDKKSWQPLVDHASIINFDFKGVLVEQNIVDVNRHSKRYLRLVPEDTKTFPSLSGVTATLASKPHHDYWWTNSGKLEADTVRPGRYRFGITTGVQPELIKVSMPLNSIITGALYSLSGPDEKTRKLETKNFEAFALSINRKAVYARPVDITRSSAFHWEITPDKKLNIDEQDLPSVLAAYAQYQLIFANDGDEPYTLVWGNRDASTIQRGNIVERIKAVKLGVKDIPEVTTGLLLDNNGLTELAASRQKLWLYLAGLAVLVAIGAAVFLGLKRFRRTG